MGKCRNTVPIPTPASRAISSVEAEVPLAENTASATSRSRARFRRASARSGLPAPRPPTLRPPSAAGLVLDGFTGASPALDH